MRDLRGPVRRKSARPARPLPRCAQCLEAARYQTFSQYLPTARWLAGAARVDCAKIEQIAHQTPGDRLDRHRVRLHRRPQPLSRVRGITDNLVVRKLAAPLPESLMMTMPVATPIRHRIGTFASGRKLLTAAHNSSPARTACP